MEPNSKNEIFYVNPNLDSLKKFTIPRKKTIDKAYLEICHTDWREYSSIHSTLDGSKLDSSYSLNSLWKFGDMKLIHNGNLEQRFAEKRAKMREDGRRGKELEESTLFLVTSHSAALKLYQEGLNINFSAIRALGNPACGVYLHRHIDVLLRYQQQNNLVTETIVFFKVLLGKVRTIPPCIKNRKTDVGPTAKFDCHMSQIPPNLKDPIDMQIINSAVYLYEFNAFCETMECPRQCLPYALVAVRFTGQEVKTAVAPLRFSSATTNPSLPEVSKLKSCTVAQRLGRGKNAKVVYQHFGKKEEIPVPPVQSSPTNSLGKVY
ncbi:protein TASOR [Heterodontus francisci]|uniref:protein TASOR n=1 Tax=Heterodontus francisci TaxID=7792 RepID=UPI00355B95C1